MKPLVVRREAQVDILEVVLRYEGEREGLGWDFDDEVARVLVRIQDNPLQFATKEWGVRWALLDRFPYAIYFVDEPTLITVLAVYHLHREPGGWKRRM